MRGSNFEDLKLMAHIVDLVGEIDSSQVGGRKGSVIVRGLDDEPRTDGAARFRTLIALMVFRCRSN